MPENDTARPTVPPEIAVDVPGGALGLVDRWIPALELECSTEGRWTLSAREFHDTDIGWRSGAGAAGASLRWRVLAGAGVADRTEIEELAGRLAPLAAVVASDREVARDGFTLALGGHVGARGREASDAIQREMDDARWMREDLAVMDAVMWARPDMDGVMEEIGFGDGPGDAADRAAIERRLEEAAAASGCVLAGVDGLLREMARVVEERAEASMAPGR